MTTCHQAKRCKVFTGDYGKISRNTARTLQGDVQRSMDIMMGSSGVRRKLNERKGRNTAEHALHGLLLEAQNNRTVSETNGTVQNSLKATSGRQEQSRTCDMIMLGSRNAHDLFAAVAVGR